MSSALEAPHPTGPAPRARFEPWRGRRSRAYLLWGLSVGLATLLAACAPAGWRFPLGFRGVPESEAWLIFQRSCRSCHGALGAGDGPYAHAFRVPAPDLPARAANEASHPRLVSSILRGKGAMPGFEDVLTDAEATAVVAMLARLAEDPRDDDNGGDLFRDRCAACHGDQGAGDGPLAGELLPRPRDLTRSWYRFRSTPSGAGPREADIVRSLQRGLGVTAMGSFAALGSSAVERVAAHVATLTSVTLPATEPDQLLPPAGGTAEIEQGRVLYDEARCWQCHGAEGRGDGPSARELRDDAGRASLPANLRSAWRLKGGADVASLARTIANGMNGTPMPSYGEVLEPSELWALARYVRSLGAQRPEVPEGLSATPIRGIPADPDAGAWQAIGRLRVPLGPQSFVAPRWNRPAVDVVEVAVGSSEGRLGVHLTWDDRFEDRKVADRSGVGDTIDDPTRLGRWRLPDRVAVRFAQAGEGGDPPLGAGEADGALAEWVWSADGSLSDGVSAVARHEDGRWRVVLVGMAPFDAGAGVALAVRVWDGSQGEAGTRHAVSAWVPFSVPEG